METYRQKFTCSFGHRNEEIVYQDKFWQINKAPREDLTRSILIKLIKESFGYTKHPQHQLTRPHQRPTSGVKWNKIYFKIHVCKHSLFQKCRVSTTILYRKTFKLVPPVHKFMKTVMPLALPPTYIMLLKLCKFYV